MKNNYMGKEFNSMASLAKYAGINASTLHYRLKKGWNLNKVLEIPVRKWRKPVIYQGKEYESITALAKAHDMSYRSLYYRLKNGWELDKALKVPLKESTTVIYQGKKYTSIKKLAEQHGVRYLTLCYRLKNGWEVDEAVELPSGAKNRTRIYPNENHEALKMLINQPVIYQGKEYASLPVLAKERGIKYQTLYRRMYRGWTLEDAVSVPVR